MEYSLDLGEKRKRNAVDDDADDDTIVKRRTLQNPMPVSLSGPLESSCYSD